MSRVIGPQVLTLDDLHVVVENVLLGHEHGPTSRNAERIVEAIADFTGTHPEGVATALTLFRSNLCGAADVLPHVEASLADAHASLDAVRTLHRPCHTPDHPGAGLACTGHSPAQSIAARCVHCVGYPYPCPTVRALDGAAR